MTSVEHRAPALINTDPRRVKSLDDMKPSLRRGIERAALVAILCGGTPMIKAAQREIRPADFDGTHRLLCDAMLTLYRDGHVVDLASVERAFRAIDGVSDISDFVTACRREASLQETATRKWPIQIECEVLLSLLEIIQRTPTALYFWYDANGLLLYIGITGDVSGRQTKHATKSSWSEFADHSKVRWFLSRKGAEAAEIEQIKKLRPLFNRAHNDPQARQRLAAYLANCGRSDLLVSGIRRG